MARNNYRVSAYSHERLKWVVSSHVNGKRERKFFETKAEAETYAVLKETELLNQGLEGASFSTEQRVLAQRAEQMLRPFGKSVLDAAEFYVQHLQTVSGSCEVARVVEELLAAREHDGMSADYISDLSIKYRMFCRTFGERMIADITTKEIADWLRRLPVGAVSRNTFRSRLTTLFSFAKRHGYTQRNPVSDVERAKERGSKIGILTVPETERLLRRADPVTLPYWAIGAFAGLRSAEIERLEWKEVDFEAQLIEVTAAKAKTASRRLVQMLPNLVKWLSPYRDCSGSVCPDGLRKKLEADRERAGLAQSWPSNALRHSFGSYHLAQFKDAAALALQMGNSPQMIFQHYRELVKPKDAERYWSITPSDLSEKLVAFAGK